MSDDAFIDAILAAPDDDAPRLVYADRLAERGDPHGEFIIVQCARVRLMREGKRGTPEDRALAKRERSLYLANVSSWVKPVGLKGWWGTYERGFITHLSNLTPSSTRKRWSERFSRMPLESMGFRTWQPDATLSELAWIIDRATLPKTFAIATKEHRYAAFDAALLREALADGGNGELVCPLGDMPHGRLLPAATELSGGTAIITADFPTRSWPHLRSLSIWDSRNFTPEEMHAFCLGLASLCALKHFDSAHTTSEGAATILRALPPPKLRELVLFNDHYYKVFEPDVAKALIESPLLPQLESLTIDVAFDVALVETVAREAKALRRLVLPRAPISAAAIAALVRSSLPSRLEELTLQVADRTSAEPLLDAPFERLHSLTLDGFAISAGVASAVVDVLPNVELKVKNTELGPWAESILRESWPDVLTK